MLPAPAAIPATRQGTVRSRSRTWAAGADMLAGHSGQPGTLGHSHHWDKPGPRHEIPVTGRCVRRPGIMRPSHVRGALSS